MLEYMLEKEVISRYAKSHPLLKNTRIKRVFDEWWDEIWIEIDALGDTDKGSELFEEGMENTTGLLATVVNLGMAKAIIITQNGELYSPPIGVSGE